MFNHRKTREFNRIVGGGRIFALALVVLIFGLIIIGRLFYMQIWQHDKYKSIALSRQEVFKDLVPDRGSIYALEKDELFPLVTNREYYLMYAEPVKIQKPDDVINKISPILELNDEEKADILARISKNNDPYEPLKKKVTKKIADQIKELKIDGLGFVSGLYRYYPEKDLGGQMFGFVTYNDDKPFGQYGLEGYFNKELSGEAGLMKSFRDALGSLITVGPRTVKKAQNGSDLVLTINREIQYTACQRLKYYYEKFTAKSASVIVMQPDGAILAMCNFPDYDPDNFKDIKDINVFNNPSIFTAYEPGSVFKAFTMAAGLDSGAVNADSTFEDKGEVKIDSFTIRNSDLKAHGKQNMTGILKLSLNTGAIYVEQKMGKTIFKQYLKNFGFGKTSGITLNKEVAGDMSSLNKSGEIYGMTTSFGQGIMATPIQLVTAFAAIANQGKLPKPYIVSEIIHANGEKEIFAPQVVAKVITPKNASLLSGMLTSVVEEGYGKKAGVKGYYFAGKTGTAQIASAAGGYGDKFNHTFIGFGPVSKPRFIIFAKLEHPNGPRFAEDTITPIFHDLAEFMLNYYQIPPDY